MEKIPLEICCGTACYLLGASKLLTIEALFPAEWEGKVDVKGVPCMNLCDDEKIGGAPFVRLNGEVIDHATPEIIIAKLTELLG
jgi:NADH:ubiquinone oxidoreductase subunit E